MNDIAISKFKATCLEVLEQVRKTGEPIQVTRFGQPIAQIIPAGIMRIPRRFGARLNSGVILGDIVAPVGDESDWDAGQAGDPLREPRA
jgi:prevent-host-death family protein